METTSSLKSQLHIVLDSLVAHIHNGYNRSGEHMLSKGKVNRTPCMCHNQAVNFCVRSTTVAYAHLFKMVVSRTCTAGLSTPKNILAARRRLRARSDAMLLAGNCLIQLGGIVNRLVLQRHVLTDDAFVRLYNECDIRLRKGVTLDAAFFSQWLLGWTDASMCKDALCVEIQAVRAIIRSVGYVIVSRHSLRSCCCCCRRGGGRICRPVALVWKSFHCASGVEICIRRPSLSIASRSFCRGSLSPNRVKSIRSERSTRLVEVQIRKPGS